MFALVLALQAEAGGLTLEKVIAEIPHDAGAVIVYLLLGSFVFVTWFGSRKSVIERYSAPGPREPPAEVGREAADAAQPAEVGREAADAAQPAVTEPPFHPSPETLRPPLIDRSGRSRKAGETQQPAG